MQPEDRWLASRLNGTAIKLNKYTRRFQFEKAGRLLLDFMVEDLSRQYIKRIRDRVGMDSDGPDKQAAAQTLGWAIVECTKMLAPFAPFISEYVYQGMTGSGQSVHQQQFPQGEAGMVDAALERQVQACSAVAEAAGALRQQAQVKLRWPLTKLVLVTQSASVQSSFTGALGTLATQTNVLSAVVESAVPTGPDWIAKDVTLEFGEEKHPVKVCLNVRLDEGLLQEALLRELMRAVQSARKEAGLQVSDRIKLTVWSPQQNIRTYLSQRLPDICKEVTAVANVVPEEGGLAGEHPADFAAKEYCGKAKFSRA